MSTADCERLRPYLLDFVVGELDHAEAERLKLESHLEGCIECRAAVEELRGTGRALEAVKAFDSQLNEQVRKDITRRAKLEAEKLRAAHQRGGGTAAGRPVPAFAWLILVLGTAAILAGVAVIPRLSKAVPGAQLLDSSGAEFPREFPSGAALNIPAGAMLYLKMADGSHLKLRGPAEAELASAAAPLTLKKGSAWLAAGSQPMSVGLAPLRKMVLAAEAQVAIEARPADDEQACVAVLGGVVTYSAPGGDGQVTQSQTLAVKQGSGQPSVRPSKATETAPWRNSLPKGPSE